jgi:hypothetical protein
MQRQAVRLAIGQLSSVAATAGQLAMSSASAIATFISSPAGAIR